MLIYLVTGQDVDDSWIVKAFNSQEQAEEYVYHCQDMVELFENDYPVSDIEPYQKFDKSIKYGTEYYFVDTELC